MGEKRESEASAFASVAKRERARRAIFNFALSKVGARSVKLLREMSVGVSLVTALFRALDHCRALRALP